MGTTCREPYRPPTVPREEPTMPRRIARAGGLSLGLALLLCGPAHGVITALTSLSAMLQESTFVLSARVDSVDSDKPLLVLTADEDLKGKAPFRRLAVNLKGDSEAAKGKQTPQLLRRVARGQRLVLFVAQRDKDFLAFAYANGTWFQLTGRDDDGSVRWAFTHFEPYLRRTFKGTTDELRQAAADALSGKKKPPEVDPKERPGIGPEVDSSDKPADKETAPSGGRARRLAGGPVFAVIPSVLLAGPLALLAMLFPVVFGGLMLVLRRWAAALAVLSLNSTLYLLWEWGGRYLLGSWWQTPAALWVVMSAVTLVGLLWAWRRSLGQAVSTGPPGKAEAVTLALLSLAALGGLWYWLPRPLGALGLWDQTLVTFAGGLWAATAYALVLRLRAARPSARPALPPEGVMLGAMVAVSVAFVTTPTTKATGPDVQVGRPDGPPEGAGPTAGPAHRLLQVGRLFRPTEPSWIASSPAVDGNRVYVGAVHGAAFRSGAVYCVAAVSGRVLWSFNDGGKMKDVFSSPCVAGGRVYVGEGFHQDLGCRLYCLDARSGDKVWDFPTNSHTESSPCVAGSKVYFGAGDDGLYCLDAATGKEVWRYTGPAGLHVDADPLVAGGRVYCGSGVGDQYKETCAFCLDAATGKELWRVPSDLPVWGRCALVGEDVYVAAGNGNFVTSDDNPRGAVLCLRAATGKQAWRFDAPDGVLTRLAADAGRVYFGCRDGHCYCLDRLAGSLRWKHDLGSPVVASPALAACPWCGGGTDLCVAASGGRVACLDALSGRPNWTFDVAQDAGPGVDLYSSPAVVLGLTRQDRWIFFGTGVNNHGKGILYRLADDRR
jgi:outer membrane protein assembly factor BamB